MKSISGDKQPIKTLYVRYREKKCYSVDYVAKHYKHIM